VSLTDAIAFIGAVRADPSLADRLAALGLDPDLERVAALAREAGFDCTPDELRRAHVHEWGMRWVGQRARHDPE
jgi:predicted ribosomally synthesized peptide with nif11-like leader